MTDKTRNRILKILKQHGPQEAAGLAKQLGVTDMAVRQHLYALRDKDDIYFEEVARPKGRPVKLWQLTEQANAHFPNTHGEFSTGLITSIRDVFGEDGMEKLLDVRFAEQVADYSRKIPPSTPLRDKLEKLKDIRTREGYMADILASDNNSDNDNEYLFVENNCPVCAAARACAGICVRELDVFREILGKDVLITRSEHIIKGARRCAYAISQPK